MHLVVRYPVSYPAFPPEVADPDSQLGLDRHRTPITGHLCLVHARDWNVGGTAAELLATQLPRLLRAAATTDPAEAAGLEVPAPEPAGHYTPDQVGARIIVDGAWRIPPEVEQGALVLGVLPLRSGGIGPGVVKRLQARAHPGLAGRPAGRAVRHRGARPVDPLAALPARDDRHRIVGGGDAHPGAAAGAHGHR